MTQWTVHTVEMPDEPAAAVAEKLSGALDAVHDAWYADFKNETRHHIVFHNRVFRVDRRSERAYDAPRQYGMALGTSINSTSRLTFSRTPQDLRARKPARENTGT